VNEGAYVNSFGDFEDKSAAKEAMQKAGVPVLPGYHGAAQEFEFGVRSVHRRRVKIHAWNKIRKPPRASRPPLRSRTLVETKSPANPSLTE